MMREVWDNTSTKFIKDKNVDRIDDLSDENICDSLLFKESMIKAGYGVKLSKIKNICNYINLISTKIGINLEVNDLINILIDSLKYINYKITLSKFIVLEKRRQENKGKSKKYINGISMEKFKKIFKYTIENKNLIILASRILITLQTANPKYIRSKVKTNCVFNGFDGENGIEYMTCILDLLLFKLTKKKNDNLKDINEKLNYYYNKFRKMKKIKILFDNIKDKKGEKDNKQKEDEKFIIEKQDNIGKQLLDMEIIVIM